MAWLNLLAAIIIYWNTKYIGQAVNKRRHAGLDCSPELLAHISPLGWAHILLTGVCSGWGQDDTLSVFSVPLHDIGDGVFGNAEVAGDPSIGATLFDQSHDFGGEAV